MPSRRATLECSVERRCARSWSSQKPGSLISPSSSPSRRSSRSGSKVITDPAELGPDLLELLLDGAVALGHGTILAAVVGDARRMARAAAPPALRCRARAAGSRAPFSRFRCEGQLVARGGPG